MDARIRQDHRGLYRQDVAILDATTTRTPEGYIRVTAKIARSGIQEYPDGQGGVMRELRHPDDVFSQSALQSLTLLPVSNLHPPEFINPGNARKYQVGYSGESVTVDGRWITIPLVITDEEAIHDVEAGRRELSVGYTVDLIDEGGVYDGQEYTHRQTNIRGNHIALVDRARAGSEARINLDERGGNMDGKLITILLDGIEYQASPEVQREITRLTRQLDEITTALEDAKKASETSQAKLDEKTAEALDLKKKLDEATDTATIEARVKARLDLLAKASKIVKTEDLLGKSDREIMAAVIHAKHADLDLANATDDYIAARFDAILEAAPEDTIRQVREQTKPVTGQTTDREHVDLAAKRQEMMDAIYNRHLTGADKED